MLARKKRWSDYSHDKLALMKNTVANASANTPFSPEYAASYLGRSPSSLQYMRCHQSDGITYSKIGGHILYRKKHLDEYLDRCEKSRTARY